MNSDPYDSAAWRTFGMMDADESAIFDEAMRHDPVLQSAYQEMNRLSAAIAATTTSPVQPRIGQLERLQSRLGLTPTRRAYIWLGISGWAAAAVLTLLLVIKRGDAPDQSRQTPIAAAAPASDHPKPATHRDGQATDSTRNPADETPTDTVAAHTPADEAHLVDNDPDHKAYVKVETKRLVQEIEVLRESLEKFQRRDKVLFEPVPGMALPVVMTMKPPGSSTEDTAALAKNDEHSPITAMLGDAVKAMSTPIGAMHTLDTSHIAAAGDFLAQTNTINTAVTESPATRLPNTSGLLAGDPTVTTTPPQATAVPIYDAARDSGTLVVSNLPSIGAGEAYHLWVTTEAGVQPIFVGSLPDTSAAGADSFDFSLGSTMILPSGFLLTKDLKDKPVKPSMANTVLQGPSSGR